MKDFFRTLRLLLLLSGLFLWHFSAQSQTFQEKDVVLNAGIGFGTVYSAGMGGTLPIGAGVEFGVTQLEKGVLGVGGEIGYAGFSGFSITYIGGRASYHFAELVDLEDDWDFYGGLGIYYRSFSTGFEGIRVGGIFPAFHAGARYYFSERLGAYGEIGNTYGWLNLGVVFKL
ncbi:hypothetical protein A3SI_08711 [Nitritalea halalkaliphila LW7]|uniref:Outer membrane protein beta-barrel domain-containing protein n=2 Tax=Nitritalea TaxID=1187887 RepID=I5C4M7_9BACT|nr:hypothetical protein A3SI_08711 [Nitritalea halalkaliphila LW7]